MNKDRSLYFIYEIQAEMHNIYTKLKFLFIIRMGNLKLAALC